MNERSPVDHPTTLLFFLIGSLALLLFGMHERMGPELADDGAFFLRYAENMVAGEFWAWNLGEAPVWGASAPLYPLVVAAAIQLGLAPMTAMVATGLGLTSASLAIIGVLLARHFGLAAGIAFVCLAAFDAGVTYYAGSGLETPVTFAVLAFALWTLLEGKGAWWVGVAAGLLMINKLDLVPTGGLLLFAMWLRDRRFPAKAVVVAAVVAAAWYAFAWFHFGAPVPNSFLTKLLHQDDLPRSIDWTWFSTLVFTTGARPWLAALVLLLPLARSRLLLPVAALMVGTLVTHVIAYSIKFPFEPYNWYAMPAVLCLLVLASITIGGLAARVAALAPARGGVLKLASTAAVLSAIVWFNLDAERKVTAFNIEFTALYEHDRAEAGRWVAENTPEDFRVYTMWGNPAYHSRRHVFDGSFLNRRLDHPNLVAHFKPEVLIMQNNPGSTPNAPVFTNHVDVGYTIAKVFDESFNAGRDYFYAVLVRDDLVGQVRGMDPPRDLTAFVSAQSPGDQFGEIRYIGDRALFVHPGASTPTAFDLDLAAYEAASGRRQLRLAVSVAPHLPQEALARGGGRVRATVLDGETVLAVQDVSFDQPMTLDIAPADHPRVRVSIDNGGSPDSDWINVHVR
ncbi:hypothetical protein [Arenimonas sp.]|uniref:hypothetical protein n=1 Tax=Arenimonas sp. TaxID=1872635 RepID=UPI002E2F5BBA|nr:hypothetical protein [Arenimonas sp.]HEX4854994.1 hypothetical protein [Arenimonas sp.]